MVAAVTDQQEVAGAEHGAALGALAPGVQAFRFERLTGFPVRSPHRPRHDVLEAAEGRAAIAVVLAEPEAIAWLDVGAAP
jgi:hypothetical protein